ncbi:hypothetical protein [Chryseobacterium koreense]
MKKSLLKTAAEYKTEFDMPYATKGIYLIEISDGTATSTQKIIGQIVL